jgi:hypothetical protein
MRTRVDRLLLGLAPSLARLVRVVLVLRIGKDCRHALLLLLEGTSELSEEGSIVTIENWRGRTFQARFSRSCSSVSRGG